jgi:quercetin dioxygenase-like cupin family protein
MSFRTSHFGGKLTCESLTTLSRPPGPDAPARKRLLLPQGELAQLLEEGDSAQYVAALELKEGGERGHHYHRRKRESVYVLQGELTLLAEDLETGERVELTVAEGDLLKINPGVAHALRTRRPGWAIEFTREPLDPADTYRHKVG